MPPSRLQRPLLGNQSIVNKMIIVIGLLLLTATVAGGVSAYLVANSALEAEIEFAGQSLVHSLSGSVTTLINKPGAQGELQLILNKTLAVDVAGRVVDAYILDRELTVLASKNGRGIGMPFTGIEGLNTLQRISVSQRAGPLYVAAPVQWGKPEPRTLGHVVFFFGEMAFVAARNKIVVSFAVVFMVALLIGILLARVASTRVLRPIVLLGQAAKELAAGNPDFPLELPQTNDEIAVATRSFVNMRRAQGIFVHYSNAALVEKILSGDVPDRPEEVKLTVGFGDGVRFSDWSIAHTPGEISSMLTDYFTLFGQLVDHYDGIVAKFIGDAVMTYFGLHGGYDVKAAAQNAIRAKVCAQHVFHFANRAFRKHHRREPLRFRLGAATGKCVVGPMGARGIKLDFTIIGTTVNLASRLEHLAAPGGLALDNFTYHNAGAEGFLCTAEPRIENIKGFPKPVQVYSVIGYSNPEEIERLRAFLHSFFRRDIVKRVLNLDGKQREEFYSELDESMHDSELHLPTPAAAT